MLKSYISVFVMTLIFQNSVYAIPLKLNQNDRITFEQNNKVYNYEGIVKLSNCSAALIQFVGQLNKDAKALVMTNGHCLGVGSGNYMGHSMPAPGEVIKNLNHKRSIQLYSADNKIVGSVNTTKIVYGTMTNTDLAFYELELSYNEIFNTFKVNPLILSAAQPAVGTNIDIISGYWFYGYSCYIEKMIETLKEGNWVFKNSLKYSSTGCETIGGTSGSPIIDAVTREVVAINNTGNDPGGKACSVMNPCEIDSNGAITDDNGRSYGQQTYNVYSCLNSQFQIDLTLSSCQLPK